MNAVQITSFYINPTNFTAWQTHCTLPLILHKQAQSQKVQPWTHSELWFQTITSALYWQTQDCSRLLFWQVNVQGFSKEKHYFVLSALNLSQVTSQRGSDNRTPPAKTAGLQMYQLEIKFSDSWKCLCPAFQITLTSVWYETTWPLRRREMKRSSSLACIKPQTFSSFSPALISPASRKWNSTGTADLIKEKRSQGLKLRPSLSTVGIAPTC